MLKYFVLGLFITLLLLTPAYAIENAQKVDYLKAEVIQSGYITSEGKTSKIEFTLSIPQEDNYQSIESIEVNSPYSIIEDDYGNKNIKIVWDNPLSVNNFEIRTVVNINRRFSVEESLDDIYKRPTELVQSDSDEVYEITKYFYGTDFDKISQATKWVHENIEYDINYADTNKSAIWTIRNRRGVCDEFSILLTSMTRNMGYNSPYIAGYAYGQGSREEDGFIPHGWAEVETYPVDATWAEAGYLDATHIKFAELPDAQYTQAEVNSLGAGGFKVSLGPIETEINILDYTESNLVDINSEFLDNTISSGYGVIRNTINSDMCLLSKFSVNSCVNSDKENVFDVLEPNKVFYTCDKKDVFSILELKQKGSALSTFTCPVTISSYIAEQDSTSIKVSFKSTPNVDLSIDKTVILFNDLYTAESNNAHIFTSKGDYAFEKGSFYAPNEDFIVYAYKDGALVSQKIDIGKEIIGVKPKIYEETEKVIEEVEDVTSILSKIVEFFKNLFSGLL